MDERDVSSGRPSWTPWIALGTLLGSLWVMGCSQNQSVSQTIEIDTARASGGIVIEEGTDEGLAQIAQALRGIDEPIVSPGVLASINERLLRTELESTSVAASSTQRSSASKVLTAQPEDTTDVPPTIAMPTNAGKLVALERLSRTEIYDLIASISLRFKTEQGYRVGSEEEMAPLGGYPEGVSFGPRLIREQEDGSTAYLRLGFVNYVSQLPQLWIQGVVVAADGSTSTNPHIEGVDAQITTGLAQVNSMRGKLAQTDLDRQLIQLSFVDTDGALNALKGLGIKTTPDIGGLPATLEFNQLPMVTKMPTPTDKQMGLVGGAGESRGSFGQTTTPTSASTLETQVNAGPSMQLMVLFHPAHPEQLSLVRSLLNDYVDRPARQVFIEGMVLEISETGLDELGVEWSFKKGTVDFLLGSLTPTGVADTVTASTLNSRDVGIDWGAKVRALIREGKAEVLSRPSVLTMNNRQATIRVGEDIPIATSQEGVLNNSNKVAFNFKYIPTGILLNIRPRITESGEEVSMLIDTVVSAQVAGRDLEIRSTDGDLLASAPTISTRRVQTYARIDNTTPFIIGGLVSRDRSISKDKVPFLGDLPIIGSAFRSEQTRTTKREVIIVLTPYVLPDNDVITRALPKDDDMFDSTGNQLFRDAYRIHAEDVFDLRFIEENKRLMIYRQLAGELIKNNFEFATASPFNQFAGETIPGEEILVQRMIYEMIKRTEVGMRVNPERIIYFEAKDYEGYNVRFLNYALSKLGDGITPESFFDRNPGQALAITYTYARDSLDRKDLASEPIPEIALVDCPNRDAWQQLLWDMNQPTPEGIDRFSILIQNQSDILRLQRALMLKKIIQLNGEEGALTLSNFSIGKILHTPEMGEDKISVVDADVAKYFFHTELYYAAIIKRIEETLAEFDRSLKDPGVQMYLNQGNE